MSVTQKLPFVLTDQDGRAGEIKGRVDINGGALAIYIEGYGSFDSQDGWGSPIWIEIYRGELRVITYPDINNEDPVIISMEEARENNRLDLEESGV
jgi:hypothetical protein